MNQLTGRVLFWGWVCLLVSLSACSSLPPKLEELWVKQQIEQLAGYLDSDEYAQSVSREEHIVLSYLLAQQRGPTDEEFLLLSFLQDEDLRLSRSEIFALAMREEGTLPDMAGFKRVLEETDKKDFTANKAVREEARRLSEIPAADVLEPEVHRMLLEYLQQPDRRNGWTPTDVPGENYNVYFGYLHAHSRLSDGKGSPREAYRFARDDAGLDFFALTDHGELLHIWPWEKKWQQLKTAANANYRPGDFVSLWGFEWSNPFFGHVSILNTDKFTDALSDFSLINFYKWIAAQPEAVGRFNHPGRYNRLETEFLHLWRFSSTVPQMVGIELWNGNDSFDEYYYQCDWEPECRSSYMDEGNHQGWFLGALGGQDNHKRKWGSMNSFRTAVLAKSLTRGDILDALRQRRFYATEDSDLEMDFRLSGFPMGARVKKNTKREFTVSGCDGSGDHFLQLELFRNGRAIQSRSLNGNCFEEKLSDSGRTSADYYYVKVTQSDDNDGNGRKDEAISSPIWLVH